MPIPLALVLVLLVLCSMGLVGYWSVVAVHIIRTARAYPTARAALALTKSQTATPSVCVMVPAHNEESVIAELVRSLLAQDYPAMRVVFVLDRCTDSTRATIEANNPTKDPRIDILEIDHCPPEWAGKVHALWTAASTHPAARAADLLLFADADTIFHPSCIRATVALQQDRSLDLLSLLSTLTADRWFEKVVQPATAMELVRQYPMRRINSHPSRRPFANGQFILFRRESYDAIGGHEAVKGEVFEDVRIAQQAGRHNLRLGVFLADGMLYCRMYKDWEEFQRGWNRIYSESCNRKPARLRLAARRVRRVGTVLPTLAVLCIVAGVLANRAVVAGHWGAPSPSDSIMFGGDILARIAIWMGSFAILFFFGTMAAAYRIGGMPLWTIPLYPAGSWLAGSILRRTAQDLERRKPVVWGGKEYAREVR